MYYINKMLDKINKLNLSLENDEIIYKNNILNGDISNNIKKYTMNDDNTLFSNIDYYKKELENNGYTHPMFIMNMK